MTTSDPERVDHGQVDAVAALRRIAYLLERTRQPTYRVRAFRNAAAAVEALGAQELHRRAGDGSLVRLPGIGAVTAGVVTEALAGQVPAYLARLEEESGASGGSDGPMGAVDAPPVTDAGLALRRLLRGDLHTHSDWSDGGSPVEEMARAARDLGHDYVALTDHSPRLTIAKGLSPERLREQLRLVDEVNERLAPFRVLTGIEVDILEDGGLDQSDELLGRLDVVVASVHSKLRMDARAMTRRMVAAVANPHTDVLGHCTGRLVTGRGRPESEFDAEAVFAACAEHGVAVEVNSRPERLDPPRRLLRQAVEAGCLVSIDTDAHAPGQLEWQPYGATRAAGCGVEADRVVNSWELDRLLRWTERSAG